MVEGFQAATTDHQQIVSSILSGVVHKYILNAESIDFKVPELLLRECEKELKKVC